MAESRFTMEQYQTLCAAYAQGAVRVKYGDKEVDYVTTANMERIMAKMELALGLRKNSSNGRKLINYKSGK